MPDIITTKNLTKNFGNVCAVKDLSLKIGRGEIYGFLGLNGAGKTTTIRMILGMIRPTTGSAFISGQKVDADMGQLWADVGYLVETPYAYPELTVWENLELIRRLRQIPDKRAVDNIINKLQLTPYRNRKAGYLSLGNAQRLGLAKALLHNPSILILDEPANGLDPAGIVEMRELFKDLSANHGVTIFISSHILGEISKFATRIGIIHQGRLVQEMNTDELERMLHKRVVVNTRDNQLAETTLRDKGYAVSATQDGNLEVADKRALEHPEEIAAKLVQAGVPPTLLQVAEEDLESYFLRTVGSVK